LVTWDMLLLGTGLLTSPYQLGAYCSLGESFLKCIQPTGAMELAENYTKMPLIRLGGRYGVHNRQTQQIEYCGGLRQVLAHFVDFLEKMKQRVRPAFDGVVLVSYSDEATGALLQELDRCHLADQFWRCVAGVGNVFRYIKDVHWDRPLFQNFEGHEGSLEMMSLEQAHECVFKRRLNMDELFSDLKANYVYQVLLQLLQREPNYANFYRVRGGSDVMQNQDLSYKILLDL
jgi:hypothetical protein